ncbi:placenta-specific protein 9 isoform X1 [Tachyglossus aculeatus]|uniref:placenta-specific protein 9 isoform X1 n=1 Tax=Tachyglossus aculeatus TaxID=9261 RepID=UPI0018F61D5B|nr:placenta-specific protein 9 isoform X1 [Tachyglossus aculeatus]
MHFIWALACILVIQKNGFSAAAEPLRSSQGRMPRPGWCKEHESLHHRLDKVEETVDKTVEHMESEVKSLFHLMDKITVNLPPGSVSPSVDIFGDDPI